MITITHKGTLYRADRVVLPGEQGAQDALVYRVERLVAGYSRIVKRVHGDNWTDTVRPKWHAVRTPSVGVLLAFANAERARRASAEGEARLQARVAADIAAKRK